MYNVSDLHIISTKDILQQDNHKGYLEWKVMWFSQISEISLLKEIRKTSKNLKSTRNKKSNYFNIPQLKC